MPNINARQVADQFITAFEGGINYWCQSAIVTMPDGRELTDDEIDQNPELILAATIKLIEEDGVTHIIRQARIEKGMELMFAEQPQHWADVVSDCGDATTADVFVQMIVFGEVKYG